MTAHTKKCQTTSPTGHDEINIHVAQKQSFEHPLYFEICVLVTVCGHHVAWTMHMLAGMRVPIKLDHDLRLVLIAYDQDLLAFQSWDGESIFYPGTERSAQRDPRHWVSGA